MQITVNQFNDRSSRVDILGTIHIVLVHEAAVSPYVLSSHQHRDTAEAAAISKMESLCDEAEAEDIAAGDEPGQMSVEHREELPEQWQLVRKDVGVVAYAEIQAAELKS